MRTHLCLLLCLVTQFAAPAFADPLAAVKAEMAEAADNMEFERAASLRDQVEAVEKTTVVLHVTLKNLW